VSTDIILFLLQDAITNAAIYALLALALILVFTVTRVIFVPQGEFVSYGALTLASMQQGVLPGTAWVLLLLGLLAVAVELVTAVMRREVLRALPVCLLYILYPVAALAVLHWLPLKQLPQILQVLITLAIVLPIGPFLYRVVFEPLANASVLVLLIAAVAAHLALVGLGLLAFGAEGARTIPLSNITFDLFSIPMTGQSVAVIAISGLLIVALFWLFGHTLYGKALRATAVNRTGARLVGIKPELSGRICFALAAAIGAISGILISPITAIYYDSGFLFALKGFVAAIIGGLASYPIAAFGALAVGIIESFSSFWASSFKEAILFALVIPILLWRSLTTKALPEEHE